MPSIHNKRTPLQPRHNRSNAPLRLNEALAAMKRGDQPIDTWRFAKNMSIKDPSQTIATIGKATNTHIHYDNKFEFKFWGAPDDVKRAKVDLTTNILQDNPTFQHQQGAVGPPRDAQFEAMGSFLWPAEEYEPAKALGHRNFESLNPIRKENNCVINYDSSRSSFIVKGNIEDVQEALLRIRGLLCKAVVQSYPVQRLYLVQNDCQEVILKDLPLKVVYQAGAQSQSSLRKTVKSIGAKPKVEDIALNAKRMKDLVIQTLSKVHWHQGHIDMRVHLGKLNLITYQTFDRKSLPDYKEMISDSYNFRAKITEDLLLRFLSATNSLKPCDRFVYDLADTKPEYIASIEVDIKDGRGNVLITKKWHQENGSFSSSNPEFKRMVEKIGRTRFLEVYLMDTLSDLTWLLDISALEVPESSHLPQWVRDHGEYYVNLKPDKARNAESFCDFETYEGKLKPLAHKRAIREKIIWRFEMKEPYAGYEVEVAKVFNRVYTESPIGGREPVTTFEERWTVDVKHRQWSSLLSENHELRAGMGAEWKADIQSWFPVESNDTNEKLKGHVELLHALQSVQDIVLGKRN
ncbi:unnamed protein product [Aureobasidium vineae]|uniref:DUF7905 domain-containing protein n=1 Tax=Aureobasidium vineae TaxID=2773715 RepID=A0A9N8J970_9PEZI|nr:unnamed protein product [Aureobasidium vineae]